MLLLMIKAGYNKYVKAVGRSIGAGGCATVQRTGKIYPIEDNTTLLHFLSEKEEESGNDWLYIVIADIVSESIKLLFAP